MGHLQRLGFAYLSHGYHFGKRSSQALSRRLHAQPIALFGAENIIVRESVSTECDLVGKCFQPLLERILKL